MGTSSVDDSTVGDNTPGIAVVINQEGMDLLLYIQNVMNVHFLNRTYGYIWCR